MKNYKNAQDYDLWLRAHKVSKYSNINKHLVFYRRNHNNFSFSKIICATSIRYKFLLSEKNTLKVLFH